MAYISPNTSSVARRMFAVMLRNRQFKGGRIGMRQIWGKVVGGALGLALGGGPLGAVLGMIAGHAYDIRRESSASGNPWQAMGFSPAAFAGTVQQASFTMGVVVLSAKMAKTAGPVTRTKIDA